MALPANVGSSYSGFDVFNVARDLTKLHGVTGVWVYDSAPDETALYVTVHGVDDLTFGDQYRVYRKLSEYVESHRQEIEQRRLVFNYFLLLDDGTTDPPIPSGAKHVDAA